MLQLAVALRRYTKDHVSIPIPLGVATGPIFSLDTIQQHAELVSRMAHSLVDMALLDLLEKARTNSLPEKAGSQEPHYLFLARQWLALVESGKQGARCIATEVAGVRTITITLHEPNNGQTKA